MRQTHRRVTSLDTVRGILLASNILIIAMFAPRPDQLVHASWSGVTAIDLIFPLFVTFSGIGLAFANRNGVDWRRMLRRSVLLVLIGLAYTAAMTGSTDPATLRFTGPLQLYAVLVLVIGGLHGFLRKPLHWALATIALAAVMTFFLAAWQSGCPNTVLTPECNPSRAIDLTLLGADHAYLHGELGHDTEGLIGILGATITALVGTTAGHLALAHRGSWRAPAAITVWATLVIGLAWAAASYVPTMKRLWTAPFGLGVGALGVITFAIGIAVMDLRAPRAWERVRGPLSWPLVAMGRNSLLVYFGGHLLMRILATNGEERTWIETLAERVDVIGNAEVSFMTLMLGTWLVITALLHRQRIYLRP
ncbi:MAG: heparan-alpha-glucosaminide N-acetyltransferase domain-containing protein [Actinomycetota bacterium]